MGKPEPLIKYLVIAVDGVTCEVTTFKVEMTQSNAITKMKDIIDDEPTIMSNGELWSSIECDEISMITDSYLRLIPIDNIEEGSLDEVMF